MLIYSMDRSCSEAGHGNARLKKPTVATANCSPTVTRTNGKLSRGQSGPQPDCGVILKMQMSFSNFCLGRMALHLGCMVRGGKVKWHLGGIRREFSQRLFTVLQKSRRPAPVLVPARSRSSQPVQASDTCHPSRLASPRPSLPSALDLSSKN